MIDRISNTVNDSQVNAKEEEKNTTEAIAKLTISEVDNPFQQAPNANATEDPPTKIGQQADATFAKEEATKAVSQAEKVNAPANAAQEAAAKLAREEAAKAAQANAAQEAAAKLAREEAAKASEKAAAQKAEEDKITQASEQAAKQKATDENNNFSAQGLFARIKSMNWLFILTVVVPTLLSVIYFGLFASDVYISESRFVVRSPERQTASPLGMLLKGTGFTSSQDDTYTVQDFMLSRDALKSLNDKLGIDKAFASTDVDIFSRFAGLVWWDKSFEALYLYYQKKVDVHLDAPSSITTLTVRSFKAEDAFRINEQLMELGEALVNQLNELGRQDMIRFASGEVRNAEKKAKAAALVLSTYRNQKGVIDPERQTTIELQQVAKLQDELLSTQALLVQLQTFTKNNPQIRSLQLQVQNLRQEIDAETTQVAGGGRSLANKAAEYQRLALEREFADKQLASALVSLEQARNEAQRKQLYLERIVQPSKPDMAMEPKRIRGIIATFILGLIAWGILTMLIAGVKEHQD